MKRHAKRFLLAIYFAFPLALLATVSRFPAIPIGLASDYWAVACGSSPLSIPKSLRYASSVGLYPDAKGWLYYFAQEHHGQPIFRVEVGKAAEAIPTLRADHSIGECAALDWREAQWCESSVARQAACLAALPDNPRSASDVLLLHRRLVAGLSPGERMEFLDRIQRARLKSAAIAFEATFLVSWQLFLLWPWLRRLNSSRKALHLLISPLLLFVPFYLGYAPLTFTFGPSGGFVYPLYLVLAGLPFEFLLCTAVDRVLLQAAPRVLSTLSQLPGPPAAITFYACVGPVTCLAVGIATSSIYLISSRFHARRASR